jgi:hypothetical protein
MRFEVGERVLLSQKPAPGGACDDFAGGEHSSGGVSAFGEHAEAVPDAGGQAQKIALWEQADVEQHGGQVSIPQQEVGGADGLGGFAAADPEEALEVGGIDASGIEGVRPIDEGGSLPVNEALQDEAGCRADDFNEPPGEQGGGIGDRGSLLEDGGGCGREALLDEIAKLVEVCWHIVPMNSQMEQGQTGGVEKYLKYKLIAGAMRLHL